MSINMRQAETADHANGDSFSATSTAHCKDKDRLSPTGHIVIDTLESRTVDQLAPAPSPLRKIRAAVREPMAEFVGTALLMIFGGGAGCSAVLSGNPDIVASERGSWLSISFGWAVGIAAGVWICGGISGGHINPAITLTMAVWRGFPWKKVPGYIFAQIMGCLVGTGITYGLYYHAIDIFEGPGVRTQATASIFANYSLSYLTPVSNFFHEFVATGVLIMLLFAMTDKRNMAIGTHMLPIALFVVVLGYGTSFGMQSYGLNPARDLGPRLFLSMAGYGKELWTYRSHFWLWCNVLATASGAQAGALVYDLFLNDGPTILIPDA